MVCHVQLSEALLVQPSSPDLRRPSMVPPTRLRCWLGCSRTHLTSKTCLSGVVSMLFGHRGMQ